MFRIAALSNHITWLLPLRSCLTLSCFATSSSSSFRRKSQAALAALGLREREREKARFAVLACCCCCCGRCCFCGGDRGGGSDWPCSAGRCCLLLPASLCCGRACACRTRQRSCTREPDAGTPRAPKTQTLPSYPKKLERQNTPHRIRDLTT